MYRLLVLIYFVISSLNCFGQEMNTLPNKGVSNYLQEFENYLLFKYETNISLKKDNEVYKPTFFEIQIPKKIKYWEATNSSNFGFYYKQDQVIFIQTGNFKNEEQKDYEYIPSKSEIKQMIDKVFYTNENKRWNIKNIETIEKRKNLILKKNGTTILLYNIKNKSFEDFHLSAQSYKTL